MDPVAVVEASRPDDPTLARSLGEAFVDDPAWAWIYPQQERPRRLTMMFDALLGAARRSGATILTDGARRGTAARFGFEEIGAFDVPDGGPHVWQLWREPSAPTT